MIRIDCLSGTPTIRHAFLTREGGVSEGIYASLNCGPGSNDKPDHVAQNRKLALEQAGLTPDSLVTAYQIHGNNVITVQKTWTREEAPKADAMVTKIPGLSLGILTADCAPVLFADPVAKIIGAAHAGWRGALSGVLENTIAAMIALGARKNNIAAAIGPAIGLASYEVGPEFPSPFLVENESNESWFKKAPQGKFYFDLAGYIGAKLKRQGLSHVDGANLDTCALESRFFSHRRMVKKGESDYGRQLSVIGLAS